MRKSGKIRVNLLDKLKIYGVKKFTIFAVQELKNKILMQMLRNSYSQCGEDLIIDKLLNFKPKGFYIDVGANDPHRFSNTKRFYKRGWHGINVEPDFGNYQKFLAKRTRDINLNIGLGNVDSYLTFYKFFPDTLSTFSKEENDAYIKKGYKLIDTIKVEVKQLSNVFTEHCDNQNIDFMSIDTEGFDMQVLEGNDWIHFKPTIICIESVSHVDKEGKEQNENQETFLKKVGYKKVCDTGLNSIYKRD